jgi:AcrR family transcriptional regulator
LFNIYLNNVQKSELEPPVAGKRGEKREDLKARLIEAARSRIAAEGLANLRARDVTQDAGCALGGLYTAFADLDELIIHVNSSTLQALEASLRRDGADIEDPVQMMRHLARGYLAFAVAHRHLWRALFEHQRPTTPQWHLDEHLFLIGMIATPLADLQPALCDEDRSIRARTLFGAVHGVISISLEGRFVGLPLERLEQEIDEFVMLIARGTRM